MSLFRLLDEQYVILLIGKTISINNIVKNKIVIRQAYRCFLKLKMTFKFIAFYLSISVLLCLFKVNSSTIIFNNKIRIIIVVFIQNDVFATCGKYWRREMILQRFSFHHVIRLSIFGAWECCWTVVKVCIIFRMLPFVPKVFFGSSPCINVSIICENKSHVVVETSSQIL